MVRRLSARPYTQAVFEIALAEKQLDRWQSDLEEVVKLGQDPKIVAFLEDKRIGFSDKLKLLSGTECHINPLVFNLVCLLAHKGRLHMLPAIAEEYQHMLSSHRGIARAEVTTAAPLDDENRLKISRLLGDITGKKVEFEPEVDPSLVSGIVVRVEGKLLDGSLRSRLAALKRRVMSTKYSETAKETATEETKIHDFVSFFREQIEQFSLKETMVGIGTVVEVRDGIAWIRGLADVGYNELLEFPGDVMGFVFSLEEENAGAVILGDYTGIKGGDEVRATGRIIEVPVGEALIGRVIDPLGRPLDGRGDIEIDKVRPLEQIAPNVVDRKPVDTPIQTGIKAIDSMFPIGRGQRELIIGNRFTGKTAIALDTIINQRGGDLICIYVAIGQKASKVAQVMTALEAHGAMGHTIIVAANASESAALQYLAPYAGCSIGEEFMEKGGEALVVYDDLTRHGWAYRQMSLLLRRPPGREAYPGDMFYLHSRLLERAAKLSEESGGGSLTALPIIETQGGDIAAYIPTNVISITDGQIYVETDLFNAGIRPAINVGLSVSRVGSEAQTKAMKKVAAKLKLEMAQYRELATFAHFGAAELDKTTKEQIERGQRITEVLKQPQFAPVSLEDQVMILYAVINDFVDDIPAGQVADFEARFHEFMGSVHPEIGESIEKTRDLDSETELALKKAIGDFKERYHSERVAKIGR